MGLEEGVKEGGMQKSEGHRRLRGWGSGGSGGLGRREEEGLQSCSCGFVLSMEEFIEVPKEKCLTFGSL